MNEVKPDTQTTEEPVLSDQQMQMAMDSLRSEQNILAGALAGLAAALLGAGVWAVVTAMTEYQIGWMAVGIGVLVGFSVRFAGKGVDQTFGFAGATLSLIGCVVGNILTITYFVAVNKGMAFMDILVQLNPGIIYEMLTSTFEIIDVLFYGLAGYFGYKYAFRQVSDEDFDRALGKAP
ncbi:hypothetical protein MnTg04_01735 [bacterium MnTg04]|nr:hypothetical protein MnTg04_01735 [bacterium MnTg04]